MGLRPEDLRFEPPSRLEIELATQREDDFVAVLRPLVQDESESDAIRLCAERRSSTGFAALQPGEYDLEVERKGTVSPRDGSPVVVARSRVSIDTAEVRIALEPRGVSNVVVHVPHARVGDALALRRIDDRPDGDASDEFIVRTGPDQRVEISDLLHGTYALRSAGGGASVTMTVPTRTFQFVAPEIAGQLVRPKSTGADISPFMEGDILVRLGQGGVDSTNFASTAAMFIAMGSDTGVTVIRGGERVSFDAGLRLLSVRYVPVSAREIEERSRGSAGD